MIHFLCEDALYVLLLPYFPFLLLVNSCKKNNQATITISGTISDSAGTIAAANVQLSVNEIKMERIPIHSKRFIPAQPVPTDFSHTFDTYNAIEYKIDVISENRFDQSLTIDPDDLDINQVNTYNFYLDPQAWFKVNLQNTSPVDSNDFLLFQITSPQPSCSGCCNNLVLPFPGEFIDTTLKCMAAGNDVLHLSWTVTKFGFPNQFEDSLYCAIEEIPLNTAFLIDRLITTLPLNRLNGRYPRSLIQSDMHQSYNRSHLRNISVNYL